jgi:hypothetical protein
LYCHIHNMIYRWLCPSHDIVIHRWILTTMHTFFKLIWCVSRLKYCSKSPLILHFHVLILLSGLHFWFEYMCCQHVSQEFVFFVCLIRFYVSPTQYKSYGYVPALLMEKDLSCPSVHYFRRVEPPTFRKLASWIASSYERIQGPCQDSNPQRCGASGLKSTTWTTWPQILKK